MDREITANPADTKVPKARTRLRANRESWSGCEGRLGESIGNLTNGVIGVGRATSEATQQGGSMLSIGFERTPLCARTTAPGTHTLSLVSTSIARKFLW
jgi:hypothetical protein